MPVQLSTMQSTSLTVDYGVKDGSATNEDYTLQPRRLTFGPDESEKGIQLNITDDQLDDDDEQIASQASVVIEKNLQPNVTRN